MENDHGKCGLRLVAIEKVEIVRGDKPAQPEAQARVDGLLARWLVRAYLRAAAAEERAAAAEERRSRQEATLEVTETGSV